MFRITNNVIRSLAIFGVDCLGLEMDTVNLDFLQWLLSPANISIFHIFIFCMTAMSYKFNCFFF